ncbi:hypothetical protein ATY77_16675 [Rhizobium sp. R634]|nr:hypothetical protein ATY77_16675 [Rhizobium sp. R634]
MPTDVRPCAAVRQRASNAETAPHSRLIGDEGMILFRELEHQQRRRQIVDPVDFRDGRAFSGDPRATGWAFRLKKVITSVNCQRSTRVVVQPAGSVSDHQYIVCDV